MSAKSINKVILIGNIGKDPEVKYTPGGSVVATFSLATNERYKDRSGAWQDRTEWHNLVAWKRVAEIVGEYTQKGSRLYVEGRLHTSSWEDKQSGERKYRTEIVVNDITLLDGGREQHPSSATSVAQKTSRSNRHRSDPLDQRSGGDYDDSPEPGALADEDIPF